LVISRPYIALQINERFIYLFVYFHNILIFM